MAQIIVRNLETDVRDRLRERARAHGRSMEEEARDILRAAVLAGDARDAGVGLGTRISQRFAGCGLDAEGPITEWRGRMPRPATFDNP